MTASFPRVGILIYLSPFLSLFFIRLLVDEPIYASTIAGLVLIVAGIAIQKLPFRTTQGA